MKWGEQLKKVIFIFILILSIGNIMFILNLKSSENKNIILNDNSDKILEFLKIIDDVLEYSKKNRINEQELSLFSNYADLKKYLVKANIDIPIYDSMIPQGITIYQNLYLITAYDSLNTLNSVCYVVSKVENKNINFVHDKNRQ